MSEPSGVIPTPDQISNLHCRISDLEKQIEWDRTAVRSTIEWLTELAAEDTIDMAELRESIIDQIKYLKVLVLE